MSMMKTNLTLSSIMIVISSKKEIADLFCFTTFITNSNYAIFHIYKKNKTVLAAKMSGGNLKDEDILLAKTVNYFRLSF